MKYDFNTLTDRKNQGSSKWLDMYRKNSNLEDNIVPFSTADMEFKHPKNLIDGLKNFLDENILGYTEATENFKKSVVAWMKRRHNFEIKEEWIVNTIGVVPALFNSIRAFTKENDGVIIMTPVYYPFQKSIKFQNRKIIECPLVEKNGDYTIDFDLFEKLSKEHKVLIFCSPHNPVGRVWKKDELQRLEKIILKNKVLLLCDEIHFDFIMPQHKHIVFQTLSEELSNQTITFTAPSKTFNLAGAGISNIIIKNKELREKFERELNSVGSGHVSAFGFKACEIVYNECEEWIDECLKVIDLNQKIVTEFFQEKFPNIKAAYTEGTYLKWIDFRSLNLDVKELEKFMINEAKLFLNEGYTFGKYGEGFERMNLAVPTEEVKKALHRLEKALNKISNK